jgi:hypothetical protein
MLSTIEVRDAVVSELQGWGWLSGEAETDFDRWLNQVKAGVWDEAYQAGAHDTLRSPSDATENPYRDNETRRRINMRYVIEDENGDQVSVARSGEGVTVALDVSGDGAVEYHLTPDEFKEFRRAVDYVWQEVKDQ